LDHLGVASGFDGDGHLPAYGTAAAWGGPALATRDFLMTPFGIGWHLDRQRFDGRLAQAAEHAGAGLWRQSRMRRITEEADGFTAVVETAGELRYVHPRFVVDASGKSAVVARCLGIGRHRLDRQVAVTATFDLPGEVSTESVTVVEACEHGWWYTTSLPDHEMVAALVSDADLVRTHHLAREDLWRQNLDCLPHSGRRVAGGRLITAPRIVDAHSACLTPTAGPGWLAVGDAAASHDPLSSSGIARALDSGIHAARAIHDALVLGHSEALEGYDERQRRSYDQYFVTRAAYYEMEGRWPEAPFWRRRQRQITLDPRGWLGAALLVPAVNLPSDLGHVDAAVLVALAQPRRRAHEIVAQYQSQATQPASDLDVVLAIQWLLARGVLQALREPDAAVVAG
jgi:flavin-dependent dehydrogenase